MFHRASPFLFALAIMWALLGALASLPWLGINTELALLPLSLPAVPFYAIDNRFSAEQVTDGLLWGSGHSPPMLKPLGIAVVYFIPATLGVIGWLWGASVPRKTRDLGDPLHRAR